MNISALNNMTPLVFNTSDLTDASNIVPSLVSTSNDVSQGYYGLGVMICIFLALLFISFKQDGDIRMGIARSLLISSGFTSIFGLIMLASTLISSFIHVMWFLTIFIIMVVIVFNLKRKGV